MSNRLQKVGDDMVLEITESQPLKRRLSEKALTRHKEYLEQSIARFENELASVQSDLDLITTAQNAAKD